jgi:hypothetical protein
MAPSNRSQRVWAALAATCLATYGAAAALSVQQISSTQIGNVGAFQPATPPILTLQIDFDIPLGSVYYVLDSEERKVVRKALFDNAMAFFPYGAPPKSFQATTTRAVLSRELLGAELNKLLSALSPGMGVMGAQMPLKYVIIDGQPMCLSSFAVSSHQLPVWTSSESSAGLVQAQVKASIGIPE